MEIDEMRENIWLIKMAQIITPKFDYQKETDKSGAKVSFTGTCEALQSIISNLTFKKV